MTWYFRYPTISLIPDLLHGFHQWLPSSREAQQVHASTTIFAGLHLQVTPERCTRQKLDISITRIFSNPSRVSPPNPPILRFSSSPS